MTAGTQTATALVRVQAPVYDTLVRLQREFAAEHEGGRITLSQVIERLLADRKPVQP